MIIPKSRRTFDPEYNKAKDELKSYIFDTKKLISSIRQLGERAQNISKCYSKMCSTITEWYPDTTPAIRQSLESINDSAIDFNKITTNSFINSIIPNFEQSMKEYKSQINDLLTLEKNRHKAVHSLDKNKEKLRKAQCAKEPDDQKIDHLQRKVDACENTYNTVNDQFISAVYDFSESRKDKLLHSFRKCISELMQYINTTVQISIIKFQDDQNYPVIVDPKAVVNPHDMVGHINPSQPILPPASSINNNNNYGQQMPAYYQNDYGNSSGQMNNQGFYPLPPSAGYIYNPPVQQNQPQDQQDPFISRSVSIESEENAQPQQTNQSKPVSNNNNQPSSSSVIYSYDSFTSQNQSNYSNPSFSNQTDNHQNDNQSKSILSFEASNNSEQDSYVTTSSDEYGQNSAQQLENSQSKASKIEKN